MSPTRASTPVIRVLCCGGLGNQLFQYAFARALSLRNGLDLVLDAASLFQFDKTYQRRYELDVFSLPNDVQVERNPEAFHRLRRKMDEVLNCHRELPRKTFLIEENPYRFQRELQDWKPTRTVKIFGYWQTEQYFQDIQSDIRHTLIYSRPLSNQAESLRNRILADTTAVAVHARRIQYGARLPDDFQDRGMAMMRELCPGARFYLFSDDQIWAESLAKQHADVEAVCLEPGNPLEDFELMRSCRHFVIANSSFSWWAAWLGEKQGSIVIAPDACVWNHPNSLPERWIPLSVEGTS